MGEVPIDRGWAWACVVGSHLANMFLIGGFKSLGVLIVEFTDAFNVPLAASTVMLGLIGGAMSILSPLGTALGERYSNRLVVVLGGIFMALACFVTSFAVNMTMVIITFGVLTGFGYGLVFGPSNVVIGQYFRARRSLASGMAVAGGSIGQLLIPLILRKLIDEYTWRGALVIYSALILHVVLGAMLFRPLSFYTGRKKKKGEEGGQPTIVESPLTEESAVVTGAAPEESTAKSKAPDDVYSGPETCIDSGCLLPPHQNRGLHHPPAESEPMLYSKALRPTVTNTNQSNGVILNCHSDNQKQDNTTSYVQMSNGSLRISNKSIDRAVSSEYLSVDGDRLGIRPQYTSTGSLCFIPYPSPDEASLQQLPTNNTNIHTTTAPEATAQAEEESETSFLDVLKISFLPCCVTPGAISKRDSLFDWRLFRNWLFLMYILGVACGNTGFVNLYMFIPKLAEDIGYDRQTAAQLLSIGGFCDLFSRVLGGWFADLGYVRRTNIMAATIFITGAASFVVPHVSAFPKLVVYVVVVGVMGGFYAALFLVVLIDLIGLERTPKAFGMTLMIMGFVNMPMPIFLGYLRDVTDNCTASFSICALLMTLSCFIFASEPLIRKMEERKQRRLQLSVQ